MVFKDPECDTIEMNYDDKKFHDIMHTLQTWANIYEATNLGYVKEEDSNKTSLHEQQQEVSFNVQVNGLYFNDIPNGLPINSEVLLKNIPYFPNFPKNIRVFLKTTKILGNIAVNDTNKLYEIVTNAQYEVNATVCSTIDLEMVIHKSYWSHIPKK